MARWFNRAECWLDRRDVHRSDLYVSHRFQSGPVHTEGYKMMSEPVNPCDVLVLDGRLRQSLATVRSLGSRGIRVAALAASAPMPTFSSRWCQCGFVCPEEEGSQGYLD